MAGWLPKAIVLKPVIYEAYAQYKSGEVDAGSGTAFDPLSIIDVEFSKKGNNYVNLRFRHTNMYWSVSLKNDKSIVAVSNQPVEDKSDPTCTLFVPLRNDNNIIQMTHLYTGKFVRRSATNTRLFIDIMEDGRLTLDYSFMFKDSDSILRIPKSIVLKGDNDKYLQGYWYGKYPYMQFSATDSNNPNNVGLEVREQRDGYLRFKSNYFGKFWRRGNNWVEVDSEDEKGDDNLTWWWPIKYGPSTIALTAESNGRFAKRLTADNKDSCLNTANNFVDKYAKMVVEEPVSERNIYNVRYAILTNARVFDEEPFLVTVETAANPSDKESSMTLKVAEEVTTTHSFSNTVGIAIGVETIITAGVPFIAEGQIKVSASVTNTLEWERQESRKQSIEGSYVVKVPPKSKVTVRCIATRGNCSVPFTYSQRDKRSSDGQFVISQHVDGIFYGISYYNIKFEQDDVKSLP